MEGGGDGGGGTPSGLFLTRALQKILAEKDTKRSQHAKLRQACEHALGAAWMARRKRRPLKPETTGRGV